MTSPAEALPDADTGVLDPEAMRDPATRLRLSRAAVRLFVRLAELWRLSVGERLTLLGDVSRQTYHNWQNGKTGSLSRDQLERISLLLGIHKGLKLVFADEPAGTRWLRSANRDIPFAGLSPLGRALRGGIDDLYAVRRYLDAWRGIK